MVALVQGDPRLGTSADNTVCTISIVKKVKIEEVHGDGILLQTKNITHSTEKTFDANPKTITTTNPGLEPLISLTASNTQYQARDEERGDGYLMNKMTRYITK